MLLSKWYCDCVSDRGDAFIGYWARLSWGPVAIPYTAMLFKPAAGSVWERSFVRSFPHPQLQDDSLQWHCSKAGIAGQWLARGSGYSRTLYESSAGTVVWRCHMPQASAAVRLADVGDVSGLGYAEELHLSIHPRLLPCDELQWGRFLSTEDSLTWIGWRGAKPRQWVFLNGSELDGATIGDDRIELRGTPGVLTLRSSATLREGPLASTALRVLPGSRYWLLRGIADAYETKWISAGTLRTPARSSTGWAIHERVRMK